ncbi:MAG: hypothetical protein PHQ43_04335 [Dehalococcoidales bacterium]|nr:hypothetical protein [Dehalococcoidales bacterium]
MKWVASLYWRILTHDCVSVVYTKKEKIILGMMPVVSIMGVVMMFSGGHGIVTELGIALALIGAVLIQSMYVKALERKIKVK